MILARDGAEGAGLEIFLLQRSNKSGFMGGLYVFPGGVVEDADRDTDCFLSRMDLADKAFDSRLGKGTDRKSACGFCVAAVRETLEEAGVFLASGEGKSPSEFDGVINRRLAPDLPPDWFRSEVIESGWTLQFSALHPWSRWITPKGMKKRFDTCFFLAAMPEGQACATDNLETGNGVWLSPKTALAQNLSCTTPLSPPAIVTLTHLLPFPDMAALAETIRDKAWEPPIAPRLTMSMKGPVIIEPWDPIWHRDEGLEDVDCSVRVLEPGEPFSRIWLDNGVWKPVRA